MGRTYREELYAARRIELFSQQNSTSNLNHALSALHSNLRAAKVIEKVREKREWVPPGERLAKQMAARRRVRFNQMVSRTVHEIKDIHERLK